MGSPTAVTCLGFRSVPCQSSRVDLFLCKGKIRKKKKRGGLLRNRFLFDFILPWEYFSSAFQTGKKKVKKKKEHQKNKQPTTAKKGELDTGLCSSVSFPMALTWQHHSLIPATGAFPLAKRGWTLYTHPQGGAGLE